MRRFNPFLDPDEEPRITTEDGVARQFAAEQAGRLRYCHAARAWFVWDGALWRRDRTEAVLQKIRDLARASAGGRSSAPPRAAVHPAFVAGIEKFARGEPALAIGDWPDPPLRLGTPVGPLDLASGRLLRGVAEAGLRRATGIVPAGAPYCPTWNRFLHEACGGDREMVGFLYRFLGYALTGLVTEQAMLFCWGPGGTGKSVFLNTVRHVLGDYARPAPLAVLTADPARHEIDLAALRGARLVTIAESERSRRWDERRLKLLTGGDPVTTGTGAFTPTFKLLVTGNQPPRLDIVDGAVRRRLRLVPFRHRPEVPDRDLEAKLRAEAPGILRWMIEGCRTWQAGGLGTCPAVEAAGSDYFEAQDVLGHFLAERCAVAEGTGNRTAAGDLFRAWCGWADESGEDKGSQRAFAEALAARGFLRERNNSERFYRGIGLRTVTRDAV